MVTKFTGLYLTSIQEGKQKVSQNLICYCFNYTATDIKNDFKENGHSTIMARIMLEKKNGGCHCESTNPKGR